GARSVWAGAAERCVFAGKRPPAELPAFLALADVVVSPRREGENTPFKVYTYMASGRPLVATRIPTHTQLLDDTLVFLVEASPEGLARGIEEALADPAAAARPRDERRPELVILDLKLPKGDGLQVLKILRDDAHTRRLPVVVLSSSSEERDIVQSYELGANSYVRKPVDFGEFSEAVRQLAIYWLGLNEPSPR